MSEQIRWELGHTEKQESSSQGTLTAISRSEGRPASVRSASGIGRMVNRRAHDALFYDARSGFQDRKVSMERNGPAKSEEVSTHHVVWRIFRIQNDVAVAVEESVKRHRVAARSGQQDREGTARANPTADLVHQTHRARRAADIKETTCSFESEDHRYELGWGGVEQRVKHQLAYQTAAPRANARLVSWNKRRSSQDVGTAAEKDDHHKLSVRCADDPEEQEIQRQIRIRMRQGSEKVQYHGI
ncbi:hypothetical protein C8R45DRAFT_931831 [Mycena sanguinolenta]|nr:hypothetical protein C8R45DRAFT_931831 [Mycena sanguinolenta]